MKLSILLAACLSATCFAQGVEEGKAPDAPSPPGCTQNYDGNFTIGSLNLDLRKAKRAPPVVANLKDGVLHDDLGRVGAIVANYQFQFDGPPAQAGSIYTGGFSVCKNNSLALGGSTIFWRCQSGEFFNLYDRYLDVQCEAANIVISPVNKPVSSSSSIALSTLLETSNIVVSTKSGSTKSGSSSASATGSVSGSRNLTISTASSSASSSASGSASLSAGITAGPSATEAGASSAPSSSSTGGAVSTRVPRRETFGAVIGILGAALIL